MEVTQGLSVKEKFGYGLGDAASNVVFQVVLNFMVFFYTDVFGLTAAAAGTLMLVVRISDAFTDPIMGGISDRTNTRWGRYRPWLLWMSVPYALLAIIAFSTPDLSVQGKLIYAYVTYGLLMAAYTAINIPYSALGGVITSDPQERASVQSWRFGLAMIGGAVVAAVTLPLVKIFGGGNEQLGFTLTMALLSLVAIGCFLGCFWLTKERVKEKGETHRANFWDDVGAILSNSQWWIIAIVTFFGLIGIAMRSGATPYYVEYYLNAPESVTLFVTAQMLCGVAGAMVSGYLATRMCKVTIMRIGIAGIIVFQGAMALAPRDAFYLALALLCIANFFHMLFIPMLFSAVPDTVDYGQLKNGKGGMAMSFSGHLLALKFGIAIAGALIGWLLSWHGYVANAEQSDLALKGIVRIYAGAYSLAAVFMYICIMFYKLKKGWKERL